jgi:hypothetical protein
MTLHEWIKWAYLPSKTSHRFPSFVLARQAGRDLNAVVTVEEFEAAMLAAGYTVGHRNRYGAAYYNVADTTAKKTFDFRRFVLVDPAATQPSKTFTLADPRSDPCSEFLALPTEAQTKLLEWAKASVVATRKTRGLAELRYPAQVVTGLDIRNEHLRGALLVAGFEAAGHRFRCGLTDEALRRFREVKRSEAQHVR